MKHYERICRKYEGICEKYEEIMKKNEGNMKKISPYIWAVGLRKFLVGGGRSVTRTRTQFLRWLPVPKGKAGLPPKMLAPDWSRLNGPKHIFPYSLIFLHISNKELWLVGISHGSLWLVRISCGSLWFVKFSHEGLWLVRIFYRRLRLVGIENRDSVR